MALQRVLFSLYILFFIAFTSTSAASDVQLLLQNIKPSLQGNTDNLLLSSWNTSVPLCQWRGLKWVFTNGTSLLCSDLSSPQWTSLSLYRNPSLHLVSLQLPSANLSGTLPRELGELSTLQSLYLGVNALHGSIPLELGYSSSLSDIELSGNTLTGTLPTSIWNLCDRMVSLKIHGNSLSGSLPNPALPDATCKKLQFLDFGQNMFSGDFPVFITRFNGLKEFDLGDNKFSGPVPEALAALKLEKLNLSHNNFSGVLPNFGESKFGGDVFEGNNPTLCGHPLGPCSGSSGLSPGAIAGIVIGLMTALVVVASLLIGYFQGKKKKHGDEEEEEFEEVEDEEAGCGEGKLILFQGGEHLTLEDVLNATGQVMEKTSYGTIYKAKLADGGTIALRLLREGSCKDGSTCLTVIRQLGRVRHENLIPLRAFYQGKRGEKLLIYDYLPNRNLHELLHESRVGKPVLNWARRHKIALGIARGLAHLHGLETPITHGNVRSKNVLVDEFFVARLTEFGLDKIMIPAVADEIVSVAKAEGYKAPELQRMKKCNSRTDVYAFGILLLEILLGKKPGKNVDLPALVKVAVLEETTMEVFVEPESNVLLASIENMQYAVTLDVLHTVFSAFGPVLKIAMFDKNGGLQALIQYPDVRTASVAKEALEGHSIYQGGYCMLHITYSRHTDLSIKINNDRGRDYTIPITPMMNTPPSIMGQPPPQIGGPGVHPYGAPAPYTPAPGVAPPQHSAGWNSAAAAATPSMPMPMHSHPYMPPASVPSQMGSGMMPTQGQHVMPHSTPMPPYHPQYR